MKRRIIVTVFAGCVDCTMLGGSSVDCDFEGSDCKGCIVRWKEMTTEVLRLIEKDNVPLGLGRVKDI